MYLRFATHNDSIGWGVRRIWMGIWIHLLTLQFVNVMNFEEWMTGEALKHIAHTTATEMKLSQGKVRWTELTQNI